MRGKVVWIAFGVLLVAGIVAGYYPDIQLAREESAARAEGLLQTGTVEKIPDAQDARQAYIAAFDRNREGVRKLQGNPSVETAHPSPEVRRLLADVEAVSRLPRFSVPRTTFPSNGITSSDSLPVGELYFSTIALTKTAVDEKGLLAAARIAGHLREGDPVPTPVPLWAAMADRVLTGVARLHLQDPARRRVLDALRPYPDLQAWMRKHVAVTYAATEKVRSQSAGRAQDRARFLRFWRGFLKDLPTDPDALAKTIGTRSAEIERIEYGITPGYSTYTPGMPVMGGWNNWATHTIRTAKNVDRLLGKP